MAVSDLHSRLDYLVAYSSQLVFVANDDLLFQQSTLQSFIAQQPENLEVAFLKGEPDRSDEDYRKEICRQILHQTNGQFDDSLLSVLEDFDGVDNPVLICLSASQHLPKVLLDEMWELVLFARTLNKNLHVNVVLFGDSKWVIGAKKSLPTNKGNQPVLLNTQVTDSELENPIFKENQVQELSELDSLIANKRAAFAQRVEARSTVTPSNEHNQTLIQTRKFQIAVGIVFFATFAALVLWFYPQQSETVPLPKTESSSVIEADETSAVEVSAEKPISLPDKVIPPELIESVDSSELEPEPETETEPLVDKILVSQWQKKQVSVPENQPESTELLINEDKENTNQAEQLIARQLPTITETRNIQNPPPVEHPLNGIAKGQFLIQISSTSNLQAAETFIASNSLQESTWIYTTTRFGGSWYVIVDKKLFVSQSAARSYIPTLTNLLKTSSPFVKSIEKIQEEIALAN